MKKAYFGLIFVICLSACSRYENYLSDQVEKTMSAIPTVTPYPSATHYPTYTPIPLPTATPTLEPLTMENFDISELFVEADLPRDRFYTGDMVFSVPSTFEYLPEPDLVAFQYVMNIDNDYGGVVGVAIYHDSEKIQSAINSTLNEVGMGGLTGMTGVIDERGFNVEAYHIAGVGDEGFVTSVFVDDFDSYGYLVNVLFKRCNVYVDVQLIESNDSQLIIDYAKKIDERIQASSACGIKD